MANLNKPQARKKLFALAVATLFFGLLAVIWQELPQWRIGGTNSAPAPSVAYVPGSFSCPSGGAGIAVIGDSHVAGNRIEAGEAPFADVLQKALGGRVAVTRYGIGGDTAVQGETRWAGRNLPDVDLILLAYGTNDAAPRGWLRGKTPVPVLTFKASLNRQITTWRERGREVVLLAPPPGGSSAIARRLAPYRNATAAIGRSAKVATLDPADAFASCPSAQPVLARDALHMNASGHQCLGRWLADQLCPPQH